MPTQPQPKPVKTIQEVVEELGMYPREAFEFVSRGLQFTVERLHGDCQKGDERRHITGQQLCLGLKDFALRQWGFMATAVLGRWNITCTEDFGRIVFALVDNGFLMKTAEDSLEDFKNVFDFASVFDHGFRIADKHC